MKIVEVNNPIVTVRRSQYPDEGLSEFLLIGRSNVGKSSFINSLVNRKNLAKTSSMPGKTQTINFYLINQSFYLVDAPGYGYASVNKKVQAKFGKMIEEYIEKRQSLKRVFMLVDFRHKPSEDDVLMYNYLKYYNKPVTIIATKTDKISKSKRDKHIQQILDTLDIVVGDDLIMYSSVTKDGRDPVLNKLGSLVINTLEKQ